MKCQRKSRKAKKKNTKHLVCCVNLTSYASIFCAFVDLRLQDGLMRRHHNQQVFPLWILICTFPSLISTFAVIPANIKKLWRVTPDNHSNLNSVSNVNLWMLCLIESLALCHWNTANFWEFIIRSQTHGDLLVLKTCSAKPPGTSNRKECQRICCEPCTITSHSLTSRLYITSYRKVINMQSNIFIYQLTYFSHKPIKDSLLL